MAARCATAVSITNRQTLEQIRLCDAEYYGAESLEAEERAPFQPTSMSICLRLKMKLTSVAAFGE